MAEPGPHTSQNPARVSLRVRAGLIRDGTQGISLSIGKRLIGEWTDSRARTLSLTEDFKVSVCGSNGDHLYLFGMPGKSLAGEQVSDTEVTVTFEIEVAV